MAMFSKGRGLFGAPMRDSFETPGIMLDRSAPGAGPIQMDSTVPTYQKPSTGKMIAGVIGDTLAQWGGGQATFLPGLQARQQQAEQAAAYQRKRTDDFSDWRMKQDYEAAHPKAPTDDTFTRTLMSAGIDPTSEQGKALYRQRAATLASPAPNFVSDGAGGGRWVAPPSPGLLGGGGAPQAPVGKLTPMGGGASRGGARTFPIR